MSSYSNFHVDLNNTNSSWTKVYELVSNGSTILDIGCSSGYFDKVLIDEKDCIVDGIEIDPEDAARAKDVCRKLLIGSIEDENLDLSQLPTDKYDFIMFIDVLEHLLYPSSALKRVARLLKPNGKILFSIPNMANNSVRMQLLQGDFDYEPSGLLDETHLHYYTDKTIDKMIKDSGMYLQDITSTQNDISSQVIKEVVSRVGLNYTKEFDNYLNSGNAIAYQYIGTIGKTKSLKTVADYAQKTLKPVHYNENTLRSVQKDARSLFKRLQAAEATVSERDQTISRLGEEMAIIKLRLDATPGRKLKRILNRALQKLHKR